MNARFFVSLLLGVSAVANSQECAQWDTYFDTNPLHAKFLSGDTSTGYGVMSFWGNPNLVLEIRGEFPRARFLSYETESTRLAVSEDHLFDYAIEPSPGSENPFREGAALDTPHRSYRVLAMQNAPTGRPNVIQLPSGPVKGRLSQAIMLRLYSPNEGVKLTKKDLPRVFAYDRQGRPARCPAPAAYDPKFHFPQFLADIYTKVKPFEFFLPGEMKMAGLNQAAGYMVAVTPLARDEVVAIRFQAPTFVDTRPGVGKFENDAETRYWSFCTQNFPNNQTLNCVPDFLAKPDANGVVTIIVGTGNEAKQAALARGYSFLPDTRMPRQRVLGFNYRNLLPEAAFKKTRMYRGAYAPKAKICSRASFVKNDCR